MKNFLVWFFLFSALATSVIWWVYFRDTFHETPIKYTIQPEKATFSEVLEQSEEKKQKDALLYNTAIAEKNKALCISIVNDTLRRECESMLLSIEALGEKDISLCDTITLTGTALECRDRILLETAKDSNNKTLCDTISNTWSLSYCRELIDEKKLRLLLSSGSIQDGDCEILEEKFRETCMRSVVRDTTKNLYVQAVQWNNQESCELIPLEEERTLCFDTLNLRNALTTGDFENCDRVVNIEKREYCQKTLWKKQDIENFKAFITNNNLEGCNTLGDINLQSRCHDTIILTNVRMNKNSSLCETLTQTGMILSCKKLAE